MGVSRNVRTARAAHIFFSFRSFCFCLRLIHIAAEICRANIDVESQSIVKGIASTLERARTHTHTQNRRRTHLRSTKRWQGTINGANQSRSQPTSLTRTKIKLSEHFQRNRRFCTGVMGDTNFLTLKFNKFCTLLDDYFRIAYTRHVCVYVCFHGILRTVITH